MYVAYIGEVNSTCNDTSERLKAQSFEPHSAELVNLRAKVGDLRHIRGELAAMQLSMRELLPAER